MSSKGYFLPDSQLNDLQRASINRLLRFSRHAHYINVIVRINGGDEHFQADWIKHLAPGSVESGYFEKSAADYLAAGVVGAQTIRPEARRQPEQLVSPRAEAAAQMNVNHVNGRAIALNVRQQYVVVMHPDDPLLRQLPDGSLVILQRRLTATPQPTGENDAGSHP